MITYRVGNKSILHKSRVEEIIGAVVLAHSLRDNGTKKQLAILVTLDSVSAATIDELKVNLINAFKKRA